MRRRLLLLFAVAACGLIVGVGWAAGKREAANGRRDFSVYIVRHAEKEPQRKDPSLSAVGATRAAQLAHVLRDASIDAVYVTQYERSKQTGQAVATALGVPLHYYAAANTSALVSKLTARWSKASAGVQVLVVGHSNTVSDLVRTLRGLELPDLTESQYDRLVVVHQIGTQVFTERLRFGVATP